MGNPGDDLNRTHGRVRAWLLDFRDCLRSVIDLLNHPIFTTSHVLYFASLSSDFLLSEESLHQTPLFGGEVPDEHFGRGVIEVESRSGLHKGRDTYLIVSPLRYRHSRK